MDEQQRLAGTAIDLMHLKLPFVRIVQRSTPWIGLASRAADRVCPLSAIEADPSPSHRTVIPAKAGISG